MIYPFGASGAASFISSHVFVRKCKSEDVNRARNETSSSCGRQLRLWPHLANLFAIYSLRWYSPRNLSCTAIILPDMFCINFYGLLYAIIGQIKECYGHYVIHEPIRWGGLEGFGEMWCFIRGGFVGLKKVMIYIVSILTDSTMMKVEDFL